MKKFLPADRYHIESAERPLPQPLLRQILRRRADNTPLLCCIYGFLRRSASHSGPVLDFHKDQYAVPGSYEINLPSGTAEILFQDSIALCFEKLCRLLFLHCSDFSCIQIPPR